MWWGRVLFTTRLEIVAWAPRLHTVVRGTPVSGYRHVHKFNNLVSMSQSTQIQLNRGKTWNR
jgi:hypothetical protein